MVEFEEAILHMRCSIMKQDCHKFVMFMYRFY